MFYCRLNNCVSRSKQFIFSNVEASLSSNDDTLQALAKEQDTICETLTQLSQKVNDLCCVNKTLEKELKNTGQASTPPNTTSLPPVMGVNPSAIVDEYLDRERRRNNLIVYNLEEPSEQTPVERSKLDSTKLAHLFQSEFRIGDFELTKCIRLGKVSQIRPRPVLLTIPNANVRSTILRSASSLRKTENFKNVYISPDMTVKEREEAKQLRAELRRRRSEGEHNLIIRRGKIVTVTHNPPQTSSTITPK